MGKYWTMIILAGALAGCAGLSAEQRAAYRSAQEWKLSRGVALLREGNGSAAFQVFAHIVAEPAVSGVTDEALFHLGLLRLEPERERGGIPEARKDLERLANTFPASPWARNASVLARFLAAEERSAHQLRKLQGLNHALTLGNGRLKELNGALTRQNRDHRATLERLISLELEMGKHRDGQP